MESHEQFMRLALEEAGHALEQNEFPVGCVMVLDGRVVAKGMRSHSRNETANELDHAEITALRDLIYRYPDVDRTRVTAYCTMEPCLMCYATLLLNDIRTIVYAYEDVMGGGTGLDLAHLAPLYRQMDTAVTPHVLRHDSLRLFKEFFTDPQNTYWQDSLLARYTLEQPCPEP